MIGERVIELVEAMCTQFGREPSEPLFRAYDVGLADLPDSAIEPAMLRAMRECEFMPTVREIRQRIEGAPEDVAELAFAVLSKNVRAYASVDFEDKRINATVRHLGGMRRLWDMTETEFETWYRKEFVRVYAIYQRRGVSEEAGSPLLGILDSTNKTMDNLRRVPCSYPLPSPAIEAATHPSSLVLKGC